MSNPMMSHNHDDSNYTTNSRGTSQRRQIRAESSTSSSRDRPNSPLATSPPLSGNNNAIGGLKSRKEASRQGSLPSIDSLRSQSINSGHIGSTEEVSLRSQPQEYRNPVQSNSYGDFSDSNSSHYHNPLHNGTTTTSNQHTESVTSRNLGPDMPAHLNSYEQSSRGWGSLSSWINTAVSTVNEVIENPNVVVSKAHNIGQGIRSVATEHIDRVYESLDPEFDYAHERQSKQPQTQGAQHDISKQQLAPGVGSRTNQTWAASTPRIQAKEIKPESKSDDISDLLRPTSSQNRIQISPRISNERNSADMTISGTKLDFNDSGADSKENAWGEDSWDDGWGDQVDLDLVDGNLDHTSKQSNNSSNNMSKGVSGATSPDNQKFQTPSSQLHITQGLPIETERINQMGDTRNVKDLFSMNTENPAGSRTNLSIPLSQGDGRLTDQYPQRRPSSDVRPADALFSTLDFASNALGSAVRKVTQTQPQRNVESVQSNHQPREEMSAYDAVTKLDKVSSVNPSFEKVGGNVVSTGLGALESLGKRAVDVISDVIPPKMNLKSHFEDSGSRTHLTTSLGTVTSESNTSVKRLVSGNSNILSMGQIVDLEQLLHPQMLDGVIGELSVDLLAGHKDFQLVVGLLGKMGVQGTTNLRQLRICTKKLSTLIPDCVNAFEQVYSDGIRALSQFTGRTCLQLLKLAETFNARLLEKIGGSASAPGGNEVDHLVRPPPLVSANILHQFIGSLIAETKFIAKMYTLTLDAVLEAAKKFTTPLDRLDWEDLSMGLDQIKAVMINTEILEALDFIQECTSYLTEILRNELMIDAVYGKITPAAPKPKPNMSSPPHNQAQTTTHTSKEKTIPTTSPSRESSLTVISTEIKAESRSPLLTPRSVSPHVSEKPSIVQGNTQKQISGLTPSVSSTRPGSLPSFRTNRSQPTQPKLTDEDFFSILNE
ncbi:hypothetical protein BGZ76_010828 [Entomortierella beljakovae]|nr:hypothetical protein BGZ76_010828 [Entomortierella beljakovae]